MSKYPSHPQVKQQLLENQDFITSLTTLLAQPSGSIYLTQKSFDSKYSNKESLVETLQTAINSSSEEPELLFRATNRKDVRISTRVKSIDLPGFMEKYGEVCRAGMGAGLKKRDRKKTKKTK